MVEVKIKSIDDLIEEIRKLKSIYGKQPIWYRGQEKSEWHLEPSIQRGKLYQKENYVTNDFYIYVKQIENDTPSKNNYAAWMSLMQHYGLPTRILDWSSSPLIACYFALEKNRDESDDACIWVLIPRRINVKEGFGEYVYPIDAYAVQQMLTTAFKKNVVIEPQFVDKIIACHSVEKNIRMYSQQSSFTVHNSYRKLEDICDSETLFKFIIPCGCKERMYESINILGISTSYVYPDMEHVSQDIIKKYSE
ncbi:MAG: FRG domain-containing protein [Lachnospiraceae bacterium]|nr:FRG domain-containing protein [Lachnospiraceae bacterium]